MDIFITLRFQLFFSEIFSTFPNVLLYKECESIVIASAVNVNGICFLIYFLNAVTLLKCNDHLYAEFLFICSIYVLQYSEYLSLFCFSWWWRESHFMSINETTRGTQIGHSTVSLLQTSKIKNGKTCIWSGLSVFSEHGPRVLGLTILFKKATTYKY